ncbi:MAG TPA: bifunctional 5,10-methylenetetrahydrofolate dehydrogenase/5,10-methenyltetrahydrofolate cyclohydrolase, partial [Candidatus Omnitrophica bacterium]|nr:bifunctional 5,10-methylenetetrahydrofolate dehydrogenase/5,10-methenyltetrahydrofolate cyclohydrolase [Candidatus Omnitrophota bacterium]
QNKACSELGISYRLNELPESTSQNELVEFIEKLNQNSQVTGIILQMPVPSHINGREVQMAISPSKDVEGIHPCNVGRLLYGTAVLAPCTALAVMELLRSTKVPLKGKEVTVVGHSEIVGKPLLLMLLESLFESPTPTVCHIATRDVSFHTRGADILIVAVGKAGLITGEMIKEGAIVIDVGINRVVDKDKEGNVIKKKIVGDVVFDEAVKKASLITPVPGGVGPVTTAMLLKNTIESAKIVKGD